MNKVNHHVAFIHLHFTELVPGNGHFSPVAGRLAPLIPLIGRLLQCLQIFGRNHQ